MEAVKKIAIVLIIVIAIFYGYKSTVGNDYKYSVINSGYISDIDTVLIKSYSEYTKFLENYEDRIQDDLSKLKKTSYTEEFFKNKSIAIAFKSIHPEDEILEVNLLKQGSTIHIHPMIQVSQTAVTDVISGILIVTEVDKTIEKVNIY